jgi:hypothetical protein
LDQEQLKQAGVLSVGHRVTILKNIYLQKLADNVPISEDSYVPPCVYNISYATEALVSFDNQLKYRRKEIPSPPNDCTTWSKALVSSSWIEYVKLVVDTSVREANASDGRG